MKPREYYEELLKAQQYELAARLARLRAKRWEIQKEAEREYDEQVDKLRKMGEEADRRTKALLEAGQESWRELEDNMSTAYEAVFSATERALERFSDAVLSKEHPSGPSRDENGKRR